MKHYTNKDTTNLVDYCTHLDVCIKHAKEEKINFWTISSEVSNGIDMLRQYNSLEMMKQDSEEFDAVLANQVYITVLAKLRQLQGIARTMIGEV